MQQGRPRYSGSRRNGVTAESWERWDVSFSLAAYVEPAPPEPPSPPPPPPRISWDQTAERLAPNGREFTFICPAGGQTAPVKGTDLYSWDSSICTAAVHFGVIDLEKGGTVTIVTRPGAHAYTGSVRNGVTSTAGDHTILGFVVLKGRVTLRMRTRTGRTRRTARSDRSGRHHAPGKPSTRPAARA
ncbi:MAG: LCCL domain-containing protein [Pseudomonas sp.]